MIPENLERQLENWKRVLWMSIGASVTLFTTAVADIPNHVDVYFPGWFGVWFILQLGTTPAGFAILMGKGWRPLPLSDRLNTGFGFLAVAWIVLIAFVIKAVQTLTTTLDVWIFLGVSLGFILGLSYLRLRRAHVNTPEEMFP